MSHKVPVDNSEWIKDSSQFNEDFKKICNEKSESRYFLQMDVQYPKISHNFHNYLPFLSVTMKIGKVEKLAANIHNKTEYVIHMRNLKQTLNQGLALKKSS